MAAAHVGAQAKEAALIGLVPISDDRLLAAREASDRAAEDAAQRALAKAVLAQAKSIREKYVRPPVTTEFAVLFLPSESLYAEVLRTDGMFERLQKDYRITPAGPTVLAALLNSLQMGFVTLAIEARSAEIWRLLGDVKAEFAKVPLLEPKVALTSA